MRTTLNFSPKSIRSQFPLIKLASYVPVKYEPHSINTDVALVQSSQLNNKLASMCNSLPHPQMHQSDLPKWTIKELLMYNRAFPNKPILNRRDHKPKKGCMWAGKIDQYYRALSALAKSHWMGSYQPTWNLRTLCTSSSRGFNTFWPLKVSDTHTWCTNIHAKHSYTLNKNK